MPFLLFMPRFAHLVFDLDGTLVDTKADLAAATNHMLESFNLPPLPIAQVEGYIGDGARVLVERALGPAQVHLVSRGFDFFMAYYEKHLLDRTQPYAGIETLLTEAQAKGVSLSVLTNKPEAASRAILSGLGLASFFFTVVGGDTLPVRKPNPHGVVYLQKLTNITLVETLLIGDSRIDVETGRAAGVPTCGVTWGFGANGFSIVPPQFLVDTPEQLRELILA
jgi:phosphoglycolate phosphatase